MHGDDNKWESSDLCVSKDVTNLKGADSGIFILSFFDGVTFETICCCCLFGNSRGPSDLHVCIWLVSVPYCQELWKKFNQDLHLQVKTSPFLKACFFFLFVFLKFLPEVLKKLLKGLFVKEDFCRCFFELTESFYALDPVPYGVETNQSWECKKHENKSIKWKWISVLRQRRRP